MHGQQHEVKSSVNTSWSWLHSSCVVFTPVFKSVRNLSTLYCDHFDCSSGNTESSPKLTPNTLQVPHKSHCSNGERIDEEYFGSLQGVEPVSTTISNSMCHQNNLGPYWELNQCQQPHLPICVIRSVNYRESANAQFIAKYIYFIHHGLTIIQLLKTNINFKIYILYIYISPHLCKLFINY